MANPLILVTGATGKTGSAGGHQLLQQGQRTRMAGVAAKVVGHRVIPLYLPFWLFRKVARQQRINPVEISGFRFDVEEMRRRTFALDGGVTSVVEDLTGQTAESFETTVQRYAALPYARKRLRSRIKAHICFTLAPFYPGYDLHKWDRQKGFPMPADPTLSIGDDQWRGQRHHLMARQPNPAPSFGLVTAGA